MTWLELLINESAKPTILAVQETRIHDTDNIDLFNIPGYNFISKGKYLKSKHAKGGIGYYIDSNINFKILQTAKNNLVWEQFFIEVISDNLDFPIIIGNVYRYPRITNEYHETFINEISSTLEPFQNSNKSLFLCGDFNLNLLDINSNTKVYTFLSLCTKHTKEQTNT